MRGQHLLAQSVERLGFGANTSLDRFGNVCREREWIEALRLQISWTIANTKTATVRQCPTHMDAAGQNSKPQAAFTGDWMTVVSGITASLRRDLGSRRSRKQQIKQ